MQRVIRCGQRKNTGSKRWSDEEILQAYWDMEEEMTGRPSPMKRAQMQLNIPELTPVPLNRHKSDGADNEE